jgi:Cu+-exporting ATPase
MKEKQIVLPVTGMTCANCVATIERNVKKIPGVSGTTVNLATERAAVSFDPDKASISGIVQQIKKAGYGIAEGEITTFLRNFSDSADANRLEKSLLKNDGVNFVRANIASETLLVRFIPTIISVPEVLAIIRSSGFDPIEGDGENEDVESLARNFEIIYQKRLLLTGMLLSLPLLVFSMVGDLGFINANVFHSSWSQILMMILATPVQFYVGRQFYIGAYKAIRNGSANMDVLVAMGSTIAYIYSVLIIFGILHGHVYFETSAVIITLIKLGKYLEAKAKGRTSDALRKLVSLRPKTATVVKNGVETEVRIDDVMVGDIIIVRPGQSIPVDGVIVSGATNIDESMVTGEPIPAEKAIDSEVIGGTINLNGAIDFVAQRVGKNTLLSQIIKLVEDAQSSKAPIQKLADKISEIFVPVVLGIAVVTFIAWMLLSNIIPVHGDMTPFTRALVNMVAVLVIACPCAMGLATPTAIMVGTGKGAQSGILIKSSEALEKAAGVNVVVLDKTGTITRGHPSVTDILVKNGYTETEFLRLAASLERSSEHPLAQAVVAEATGRGLELLRPDIFTSKTGMGVAGEIAGKSIIIGNITLIEEEGISLSDWENKIRVLQNEGKTPIYVAIEKDLVGLIAISDQIKQDSKQAIARIKEMGIHIFMITGDNKRTAMTVAKSVGIDDVIAEVLPGDKAAKIIELQKSGNRVMMVGDGINDAPALAQADVGLAIGSGTDIAMASAPIILVSGEMKGIGQSIKLAKNTVATIKQNLFWAFFYNIILIPVAAAGLLIPILAAGAMAMSSVFVVFNSLRLNRKPIY